MPGSPSKTTNRASKVASSRAATRAASSASRPTTLVTGPATMSAPTAVGRPDAATGTAGKSRAGSWARIAASRSRSCRLGSMPSSSRNVRPASASARKASAWRPDR